MNRSNTLPDNQPTLTPARSGAGSSGARSLLSVLSAGVIIFTLAGCGEATTGDDPTARAPKAPYASPATPASDNTIDRRYSDGR